MSVDEDLERRTELWRRIGATRPSDINAAVLRQLRVYGGPQGIWVDSQLTSSVSPGVANIAVSILHTGAHYQQRSRFMKMIRYGAIVAVALIVSVLSAQGAGADTGVEFGFMPSTMTVTLLNEGGKYVGVDLKHIPQGGTCRMDKDAIIARVGPGAPGMTRVQFATPQLTSGGCPFMTQFDLSDADYAAAHAAFDKKKDEASKKLDELKKQLGDKWNEVTGQKSN